MNALNSGQVASLDDAGSWHGTPADFGSLQSKLRTLLGQPDQGPEALRSELLKLGLVPAPLFGRRVAISGSSRAEYPSDKNGQLIFGIGDEVALAMLQHGATVTINSHQPQPNQGRFEFLQSVGPCFYNSADLSTEKGAREFVRNAFAQMGGLDVLVLNAGMFNEPDLLQITSTDVERVFGLNTFGPLWAIQEYLTLVGERAEKGRIIVTSSINAQMSEVDHTLYDCSKAALEAMIRQLSLELVRRGLDITINGVAPGLHYTPLTYAAITANESEHRRLQTAVPLGIGRAADVIMPYLMLADARSSYVSGTVIDASGGLRVRQAT